MRIFITCVAGLLGSHLCDCQINMGQGIIGVNNFITGNKQILTHLRKSYISWAEIFLASNPKISFYKELDNTIPFFKEKLNLWLLCL